MKCCDACKGSDVINQFAWLIEGDGWFWNGHTSKATGFTRDVNLAVRFARKEDADVVKHHLLEFAAFALRTTEHCWMNGLHHQPG